MVSAELGIELPSKDVVIFLVDNFIDAVHWYHCMFHEPTFRKRLQPILESGAYHEGEESFLFLLLIVMVTGAQYLQPEKAQHLPEAVDIRRLQSDLMRALEAKFFIAFDEGSLDSVAFLFLTASHFLLAGRSSRGFTFIGIAVRVGQSIGLYNESLWHNMDPITREMRRRLFWSLYVADGYDIVETRHLLNH